MLNEYLLKYVTLICCLITSLKTFQAQFSNGFISNKNKPTGFTWQNLDKYTPQKWGLKLLIWHNVQVKNLSVKHTSIVSPQHLDPRTY